MWAYGIIACALRVTLSTHLPISEGWAAELAVSLQLMVPLTRFKPCE